MLLFKVSHITTGHTGLFQIAAVFQNSVIGEYCQSCGTEQEASRRLGIGGSPRCWTHWESSWVFSGVDSGARASCKCHSQAHDQNTSQTVSPFAELNPPRFVDLHPWTSGPRSSLRWSWHFSQDGFLQLTFGGFITRTQGSVWVRVTYVPDTDRSFLQDFRAAPAADPRVASVLTTQGHPVTRHEASGASFDTEWPLCPLQLMTLFRAHSMWCRTLEMVRLKFHESSSQFIYSNTSKSHRCHEAMLVWRCCGYRTPAHVGSPAAAAADPHTPAHSSRSGFPAAHCTIPTTWLAVVLRLPRKQPTKKISQDVFPPNKSMALKQS